MLSTTPDISHLTQKSVMILDDDVFLIDLIGDMLRGYGMSDIRALSDGRQALISLHERHPDILLCDLNMPNLDGVEFIRQLGEHGFKGEIVVMSSASITVLRAVERLAKAQGHNCISVLPKPFNTRTLAQALARNETPYTPETSQEAVIEPITLQELRDGIDTGCVTLVYQPKVPTKGRQVMDVECLSRWRHAKRGILPPAAFIALAEDNKLITEMTMVILRQAAAQLLLWNQAGCNIRVAVNISMDSMHRLDLPDLFDSIVRAEGVKPTQFVLEITESRLTSDLTMTLDILTRLRIKGFDLAIDDFGTGYSTLENLRQLPFSELKLDQSFVSCANSDRTKRAILESSVRLGKALRLNLVAEGVETIEEWELICAMGCHEVQGFFVARPMPPEELLNWIIKWEKGEQYETT